MSEVRLIDANALKKDFARYGEKAKFTQGACQQLIDNVPTLPNPCGNPCNFMIPTGEWIYTDKEMTKRPKGVWLESNKGAFGFQDFACSNCHTEIKDMPTDMTTPIYNYCPTCGAKMIQDQEKKE